jgi:hypothetical protein
MPRLTPILPLWGRGTTRRVVEGHVQTGAALCGAGPPTPHRAVPHPLPGGI